MVSSEEMLGDRERKEVGVDGTDEEDMENEDGYDSVYAARAGVDVLGRKALFGITGVPNMEFPKGLRGDAGRRLLLASVWWVEKDGEEGGPKSRSPLLPRGVRSSSEFSEMVWSMSRELP